MSAPAQVAGQATDDTGGLAVNLSYAELLRYDDRETTLRSTLDFALSSRTHTQSFDATLAGDFDKRLSDPPGYELDNPNLSLHYGLENRNTAFNTFAHYQRTELDTINLQTATSQEGTSEAIVIDGGDQELFNTGFNIDFGMEAPFGGTLSLAYNETRFNGTRTTQIDSSSLLGTARLRLNYTPNMTQFVTLTLSDLDRDGGIDVRREQISTGINLTINQVLTANATIGRTEVVQSGSVARTITDGAFFQLGLSAERPNGDIQFNVSSDVPETGRRSTARVTRALTLPRGTLVFGGGASYDDETDDVRPLYNLDYQHELPRGGFRASLTQGFSTSSAGVEQLDSRLSLSLNQQVTAVDIIGIALSLQDSNQFGTGAVDSDQINLSLDYSRSLAQDWTLISGFSHTRQRSNSQTTNTRDQFFVGLRTSLGWRP